MSLAEIFAEMDVIVEEIMEACEEMIERLNEEGRYDDQRNDP